ncbi:MAG TPA: ATP-binding protein [Herpetosiphonaceae bacterium]|nr:ATP-binding protein [Herpetosiphonaceae bacterium]
MRYSIRTKLVAAFALNLILMLALGVFALHQFRIMNQKAGLIERVAIPSLSLTDRFNFGITKYRSLQLEYIINNSSADKSRIEGEMGILENAMTAWTGEYDRLVTDEAERAAFLNLQSSWATYVSANNDQFLPASRQHNTGTVQPALNRLNPLYEAVLGHTEALARQSQAQASGALETVRATYATSRYVIVGVTGLTLLISSVIGLVLAARIGRRVGRLSQATLAVAAGDLQRRVLVRGRDDLAALSENFNQMVGSLREQRTLLEQRNEELQASLRRQQQLTEDLVASARAEEEALRAQAAAEAASQAKSLFVATMSHEFRTPLNAILGYTQLLKLGAVQRGYAQITPELERITVAGKHLLTLVTNILDYSKLESGKMALDPAELDVAAVCEEVIGLVAPLAEAGQNALRLHCAPAAGAMWTDAGKVRQVLFNLLSNAIKFTHAGAIRLEVGRESTADGDWLHFAVSDTGIGMTQEQMNRLFTPFTQADASTTRKYGGTGLGLSLSRELCHLMGGDISVQSEAGCGSTFTAHLPARAGAPTHEPNRQAPALAPALHL